MKPITNTIKELFAELDRVINAGEANGARPTRIALSHSQYAILMDAVKRKADFPLASDYAQLSPEGERYRGVALYKYAG